MRISFQSKDIVEKVETKFGSGQFVEKKVAATTFEDAIAVYQELHNKNPKDTSLGILLRDANVDYQLIGKVLADIFNKAEMTSLDLTSLSLTPENLAALAQTLSDEKTLNSLNLTDNNLGDEGVKILVSILKANSGIKDINININNITDVGAATLGAFLQNDTKVNTLHVSGNVISNADSLLHNNLTNIYLDSNNVTSLDKTPTLPQGGWVDFSNNSLTSVSHNFIKYFEDNKVKLDLRDTGLTGASTDCVLYGAE